VAPYAALQELFGALLPGQLLKVTSGEAVVDAGACRQIQKGQRGHLAAGELGADRGGTTVAAQVQGIRVDGVRHDSHFAGQQMQMALLQAHGCGP